MEGKKAQWKDLLQETKVVEINSSEEKQDCSVGWKSPRNTNASTMIETVAFVDLKFLQVFSSSLGERYQYINVSVLV